MLAPVFSMQPDETCRPLCDITLSCVRTFLMTCMKAVLPNFWRCSDICFSIFFLPSSILRRLSSSFMRMLMSSEAKGWSTEWWISMQLSDCYCSFIVINQSKWLTKSSWSCSDSNIKWATEASMKKSITVRFRPQCCTVWLYRAWDEFWYESCPLCRIDHSTCWPAVQQAASATMLFYTADKWTKHSTNLTG